MKSAVKIVIVYYNSLIEILEKIEKLRIILKIRKKVVTIQLLLNNHREHRVHRDNFFEYEIDENFIFNSFVYFRI
ncbi:MAG: hypothetical protein LBJ00_12250, partial [Planctomycetaceae bacterium]|nr:hypothetical protein [Planctomycetaceae bacterium]